MCIIIGASLSKPHINGKAVRDSYMYVCIYHGTSVISIVRPVLYNVTA